MAVRRSTHWLSSVLKNSDTSISSSAPKSTNDDTVYAESTIGNNDNNTQERSDIIENSKRQKMTMIDGAHRLGEQITFPIPDRLSSISSSILSSNGNNSCKKSKRIKVKTEDSHHDDWKKNMNIEKSAVLNTTNPYRTTPEECEFHFAVRELSKLHQNVIEKTKEIRKFSTITTNVANNCMIDKDIVPGVHVKKEDDNEEKNEHQKKDIDESSTSLQASSCGLQPTILDGVVSTLLSQNTTAANSTRAFSHFKKEFPDWNTIVLLKTPIKIENAIRCGGLAKKKAENIFDLCRILKQERGEVSLEYLRANSNEEIKKELLRFKGLGKKTVSCVLLFTLGRDEFPVDTHVHRISIQQKWIPINYSRDDGYEYLNERIPSHLKLDLHCLLVQHGRECHRCAARGKPQFPPLDGSKLRCPLIYLMTQKKTK